MDLEWWKLDVSKFKHKDMHRDVVGVCVARDGSLGALELLVLLEVPPESQRGLPTAAEERVPLAHLTVKMTQFSLHLRS